METATKALIVFGFFSMMVGCSGTTDDNGGSTSRKDRVVLDVRCSADGDCPTGFECEVEQEHGTSTSYCKSHESSGTSSSAGTTSGSSGAGSSPCPPGFEQEIEHGGIFCKPHGGGDDASDGAAASSSGGGSAGAACTTNAGCAAGLECETELEHGVTTSFCKAHGGDKS